MRFMLISLINNKIRGRGGRCQGERIR